MKEAKLEKAYRVRPRTGWSNYHMEQSEMMQDDEHGGYVPYTTYCHNVSKLQARVRELETTIIGLVKEISDAS